MSPSHYGSTKAAVYLAGLLAGKPLLSAKIDRLMVSYNKRANDITYSNLPGSTKIWALTSMIREAFASFEKFESPLNTLCQNICKGKHKTMLRAISARGEASVNGKKYKFMKYILSYEEKQKAKIMKGLYGQK
jgi:hypothetical protein